MSCSNCNEGNHCGNPCHTSETNTPACESLPSQIENFTKQFFGEVFKTEVNGGVVWSLPCQLDVGLPANPRGVDEGLACYFLRLFQNGITGLKGATGATGSPGVDGRNSYTVILQSFTQPTLASPFVHVTTQFNPTILDGSYVFIENSGWYLVNGSDGNGVLFLQLVSAVSGASGTVIAGKLVVPAGIPGNSVQGIQGPEGVPGPQGIPGNTFTSLNGSYISTGNDFTVVSILPTYAGVSFPTGNTAQLLLPVAGTYLVTATTLFTGIGAVASADGNTFNIRLRNTSLGADVSGTEVYNNHLSLGFTRQLTISALTTTTGANQTISLFAGAYAANVVSIEGGHTFMNYVRLS